MIGREVYKIFFGNVIVKEDKYRVRYSCWIFYEYRVYFYFFVEN